MQGQVNAGLREYNDYSPGEYFNVFLSSMIIVLILNVFYRCYSVGTTCMLWVGAGWGRL